MERAAERDIPRIRFGRVHAHAVDRDDAIELIVARAHGGLGGFVMTPNVDHVAIARRSPALVDAYRSCFLSVADGMPLVLISKLLGLPLHSKVSGSDVFEPLLARCATEGLPVFFFGSTADCNERAITLLNERYPTIQITGYDASHFDPEDRSDEALRALHRARASGARVVICSLPPAKQVLLSTHLREYAPAVGVATGAALGFFVGDVKRAPTWVSDSGFEWVYRLFREPARLWRRYLVEDIAAVPVFLGMVLRWLTGRRLVANETVLLRRASDLTEVDLQGPRTRSVYAFANRRSGSTRFRTEAKRSQSA